ncbi:MAG TPA: hypothetical protein VL171_14720 [Verrucomicrobiae bacterium]|nr:hypothetical protein [Verrucomicrobiae bacterium]
MKLTREYLGGVLAGIGVGLSVAYCLQYYGLAHLERRQPFLFLCAMILVTFGGLLARAAQRRIQSVRVS